MKALALRITATLVLVLFAGLGTNGCTRPEASTPQAEIRKVVLISLDTLRADALGAYDHNLNSTPHIDRFSATSVVFDDTLSTAPSTALSHKSIFTSLYPSVHKTSRKSVPTESGPSPLETLQDAGFLTGAVTGGGALRSQFGFDRGFDHYYELDAKTRREGNEIPVLRDEVTRWLEAHHDESFFLFVHTYQPHYPYDPPAELEYEHAGWYRGRLEPSGNEGPHYDENPMSPEDYRYLRDLYRAEVEYTDAFVGSVLAELRRHRIDDETIVILLSDHGEAFGEKGHVGHNHLRDVILRTPLIVHVPGIDPRRVQAPVSLIDVMPTLFELLELERPYDFQGRSLAAFLDGETPWGPDRVRIAETPGQAYVQRHPFAMLYKPDREATPQLFDIELDPNEETDVAGYHAEILAELLGFHEEAIEQGKPFHEWFKLETDSPELDEETERQLRELGYIK